MKIVSAEKKIVDQLVEACTETVEEVKIAKISLSEDKNKHKCSSCALYIVLFSVILTINVGIVTYCVYFQCYLKKDVPCVKFGTRTQIYYFYNDMINLKDFDSN